MTTRARALMIVTASLVTAASLAAAPAFGQSLNHLKCYAIEDSLAVGAHSLTLDNELFGDETCQINTPARMFCTETFKSSDSGGDDPRETSAGNFLCYRGRGCTTVPAQPFLIVDQFGDRDARTTENSDVRWVCAPATILGNEN
jgi:hypothetical protein